MVEGGGDYDDGNDDIGDVNGIYEKRTSSMPMIRKRERIELHCLLDNTKVICSVNEKKRAAKRMFPLKLVKFYS